MLKLKVWSERWPMQSYKILGSKLYIRNLIFNSCHCLQKMNILKTIRTLFSEPRKILSFSYLIVFGVFTRNIL